MVEIAQVGLDAIHDARSILGLVRRTLLLIILTACSLLMAGPLIWVLTNSFKREADIFTIPPSFIPNPFVLENYQLAFTLVPILPAYINTIEISILATLGTLFTSSLAAYGFSRLRFVGRDFMFLLLVATMMIPFQITLIPSFILFHKLGWLDTFLPLIIPPALTNGFGVFLLRQFLATVPTEYDDAARIDGANPLQTYWFVVLPLAQPALVALAILSFLANWNAYLGPLIYLNSPENYTIQLVISTFRGINNIQFGGLLAATSLAIMPMLAFYAVAQRYFIEGISMGGLKG